MKKLLAVGVIVLFIGLAIAPSINANIGELSVDIPQENDTLQLESEFQRIRAYIEMQSDGDCDCDDDIGWSFPITCLILLILFEFIVSHSPYPVPLMCHVIMFIAQIFGCKDFP